MAIEREQYALAFGHRERTAGTEVLLDIDNQQSGFVAVFIRHRSVSAHVEDRELRGGAPRPR